MELSDTNNATPDRPTKRNLPSNIALPITPGTYLRLRRQATGLSVEAAVAKAGCSSSVDPVAVQLLADNWRPAENDQAIFASLLTWQIARFLLFDNHIYDSLVANRFGHSLPIPQLCRSCGCSWHFACTHAAHGPCSWSVGDSSLCSYCEDKQVIDVV